MVKGAAGMLHTSGAPVPKAPPAPKPATAGGIGITFGDMWIKSTVPSAKAGKVSFNITNQGQTMHGFAIVPAPAKVSGGLVDESTFIASGDHLAAGASGTVTADLKPGTYELICHVPGHYAAGQKTTFEVK
jgi:uncharacterized cupredoxin-like copper-binding protein